MNFTRKKQLTKTLISLNHTDHVYVKVAGPAETLEVESLVTKDGNYPTVYPVIDLESGEECQIIAGAVLKSAFEDFDDSLPGRCFEIEPQPRIEGKKYLPLKIWEIDEPGMSAS